MLTFLSLEVWTLTSLYLALNSFILSSSSFKTSLSVWYWKCYIPFLLWSFFNVQTLCYSFSFTLNSSFPLWNSIIACNKSSSSSKSSSPYLMYSDTSSSSCYNLVLPYLIFRLSTTSFIVCFSAVFNVVGQEAGSSWWITLRKGLWDKSRTSRLLQSWQLFLFVDVSIGLEHHVSLLEI